MTMFIRRTLAPGKNEILKALRDEEKSYTQLKKDAKLSDPVLSDYLKWLWKKKYIVRDIDSRKYRLLKKGRNLLPIITLVDQLNLVLRRGETNPVKYFEEIEKTLETSPEPLKKNTTKIANCISILHESFSTANSKIMDIYGKDPFIRTRKLDNGTILIDFMKAKEI